MPVRGSRGPKLCRWWWIADGDRVTWSEPLYRLFGLDPSQPAPSWSEQRAIYTEESYARLSEAVGKCLESGEDYHLLVEGIARDGSGLDLEASGSITRSEAGAVIGVSGVLIDRRNTLTEEELFREIADFSPDWESWFSPEGKYLWVSPAVEAMTGYTCGEIVAIPDFLGTLIAPEHVEMVREHFVKALAGVSGNDVEFQCVRKDGERFWVSGSWQMVYDDSGRPLGVRTSKRDISRRKAAEEQFTEKSRLLAAAGRIGRIAGWRIDGIGAPFVLSDEGALMLAAEPGLRTNLDEFLSRFVPSADDRASVSRAVEAGFASGAAWDVEVELVTASGRTFWSRMVGEPVIVDGRTAWIEGILQDISAQRTTLEEMRKFRQLIDGIEDFIYFKDREHRFELVNAHILRINNYTSQAQMAGRIDHDFEDKETADEHRAIEEEILRTGTPVVNVEELQRIKDTLEERWYSTTKIPCRNLKGEIVGLMGISREITDLKRREKELEEKNRELKRLHQSENIQRLIAANLAGGIGIWEWNLETNALLCDAQYCRLHGRENGSLETIDEWSAGLEQEDRKRFLDEVARLARGETNHIDLSYWVGRPDSSRRCLRALGYKQSEEDGRPGRIIGTLWDITREKTAQQEIERAAEMARLASEAKSNFLANISHEIRTPLNAIIGLSELLLESPSADEMPEMLRTIQHSGNMLLSLISGVLDLSKIEAGSLTIRHEPFDLRACLESALAIVGNSKPVGGLELRTDFSPALPARVMGDGERVLQVAVNLLINAVKFTPSGTVTLSAIPSDKRLCTAVSDTGIGISPDDQRRLFQNFTQVDPSLSRRQDGAGLGLALSKKLTELMGGTIEVESEVGRGSTFRVFLPLEVPAAEGEGETLTDSAAASLPSLRVLIVEDNPVNLRVVTLLVQRLGMTTHGAKSGAEALEILEKESFDAILMDMQMPGMDGLEVTAQICKRYPRADRPRIIALTANATVEDRNKCLAAGMDDFLTKPIKSDQLAEALRRGSR